jgi:hypothetical protein
MESENKAPQRSKTSLIVTALTTALLSGSGAYKVGLDQGRAEPQTPTIISAVPAQPPAQRILQVELKQPDGTLRKAVISDHGDGRGFVYDGQQFTLDELSQINEQLQRQKIR